jgi:uncharacterized membrane protein YeaQ/YmgE (transglycosylase-associated protein family)
VADGHPALDAPEKATSALVLGPALPFTKSPPRNIVFALHKAPNESHSTEATKVSTIVQIIISLISGGVGGNIAGALLKNFSLGPVGNTVVGLLGGGIGEKLLTSTGLLQGSSVVGDVAGSGIGGAILMVIVGLIKNMIAPKTA